MPYQMDAFNADHFVQKEFLKLKDQFGIDTAIELGTCFGSTSLWMSKNFEKVITIEINPKYAEIAQERFERDGAKNIELIVGDTIKVLPTIINRIPNNSIWLVDSHWLNHCPMLDELKIIADAGIKPVIAIHDFLVPNEQNLGFDTYNGQPFTLDWIRSRLYEIYGIGQYEYYYNSDATSTAVKRGIIYITPKQ